MITPEQYTALPPEGKEEVKRLNKHVKKLEKDILKMHIVTGDLARRLGGSLECMYEARHHAARWKLAAKLLKRRADRYWEVLSASGISQDFANKLWGKR